MRSYADVKKRSEELATELQGLRDRRAELRALAVAAYRKYKRLAMARRQGSAVDQSEVDEAQADMAEAEANLLAEFPTGAHKGAAAEVRELRQQLNAVLDAERDAKAADREANRRVQKLEEAEANL